MRAMVLSVGVAVSIGSGVDVVVEGEEFLQSSNYLWTLHMYLRLLHKSLRTASYCLPLVMQYSEKRRYRLSIYIVHPIRFAQYYVDRFHCLNIVERLVISQYQSQIQS
jgi:hypothetical protein